MHYNDYSTLFPRPIPKQTIIIIAIVAIIKETMENTNIMMIRLSLAERQFTSHVEVSIIMGKNIIISPIGMIIFVTTVKSPVRQQPNSLTIKCLRMATSLYYSYKD